MIPKVIHYCWFGKGKKSKLINKCIKSWTKYCPDYEIKEWNEDNFDIEKAPLYVKQAYEAKKWAFVSDYVRLLVLYNYGGVYMDTDVEVINSIDDFLSYKAFSGFENPFMNVPTGIMACEKELPIFKEFLDEYNNIPFIKEDGTYDYKTNVERITDTLCKYGLILNNEFQIIKDFALFPVEYFCPLSWKYKMKSFEFTKNTKVIHHFTTTYDKKRRPLKRKFRIVLAKIYIYLAVSIIKFRSRSN